MDKSIFMTRKNKPKVGDIVECWGFDDSPPKSWQCVYPMVKRAYHDVFYWCKCLYQKIRYGFAHEDAWSFYSHCATWSLPRLKFLRANLNGHPIWCVNGLDNPDVDDSHQKWEKVLDKIIWSMENHDKEPDVIYPPNYISKQIITKIDEMGVVYAPVDDRPFDYSPLDEHGKRVQEGFELFGKHFRDIWD